MRRVKIVKLNDFHVPYQDDKAIQVAFNFIRHIQPDIIVIDELHDFYSVSCYDKDPLRINSLQEEIDQSSSYLRDLRIVAPHARIILLDSNHLDRLRRYIWKNAPAFAGLRSLEPAELLDLKTHGIEFMDYFIYKDFIFKHGDIVRKDSAYTAKGEFSKEDMSGMSGHTHRIGQYYTTKRGGSYTWVEAGCLCDLRPEYIKGTPDWQHGLGYVEFKGGGSDRFYARAIPIIDYKIYFGGEEFTHLDKTNERDKIK